MSKNYICQDCKSNNNGWCTVRKCNGLKKLNITSCNTYETKNENSSDKPYIATVNQPKYPRPPRHSTNSEHVRLNREAHRVLGKREMLWKIQSQVVAINEDSDMSYEEKYKNLVKCIKNFGIHLEFKEKLWNVDSIIDSIIDEDMIKDSKYMNNNML